MTQEPETEVEQDLKQVLAAKPKRRYGFLKALAVAGAAMVGLANS